MTLEIFCVQINDFSDSKVYKNRILKFRDIIIDVRNLYDVCVLNLKICFCSSYISFFVKTNTLSYLPECFSSASGSVTTVPVSYSYKVQKLIILNYKLNYIFSSGFKKVTSVCFSISSLYNGVDRSFPRTSSQQYILLTDEYSKTIFMYCFSNTFKTLKLKENLFSKQVKLLLR